METRIAHSATTACKVYRMFVLHKVVLDASLHAQHSYIHYIRYCCDHNIGKLKFKVQTNGCRSQLKIRRWETQSRWFIALSDLSRNHS